MAVFIRASFTTTVLDGGPSHGMMEIARVSGSQKKEAHDAKQ